MEEGVYFKNIILLILIVISTSGCAKIWPYKSDFDCPIEDGLKCRSLYEVSRMADKGVFGADSERFQEKLTKKDDEDLEERIKARERQEKIKHRKNRRPRSKCRC